MIEMEWEIYGVALIPAILGLVELAKKAGLPDKWSPVFAVVLGLGAGLTLLFPGDLGQGVVVGLALGLSATGLYSGAKNVKEELQE